MDYEHEQYGLKKISAFTVTQRREHGSILHRNRFFDVNMSKQSHKLTLRRNIQYIADSLIRYIYDEPNYLALDDNERQNSSLENRKAVVRSNVFENSLQIDDNFVSVWSETLSKMPRVVGLMPKDSPILSVFYKVSNTIVSKYLISYS